MTTFHKDIENEDDIHLPKGFKEALTDVVRVPSKQIDGSYKWIETSGFAGAAGPAGPPLPTLSVTNILDPTELSTESNTTLADDIVIRQARVNKPDYVCAYKWDVSGGAPENIPFTVDGVGGQWNLTTGKVPDFLRNIISSGTVYNGGEVTTASATTVDISEFEGFYTDNFTAPNDPVNAYVKVAAKTGEPALNVLTQQLTVFGYDRTGTIQKTNAGFTTEQERDIIRVGFAYHPNGVIVSSGTLPLSNYGIGWGLNDLTTLMGAQNIDGGNRYSPGGLALSLNRSEGETYYYQGNFAINRKDNSKKFDAAVNDVDITYVHSDTPGHFAYSALTTSIDPNNFNNLTTNTLNPVGVGNFTNQYIFWSSLLNQNFILYGQEEFASYNIAIANTNGQFIRPDEFKTYGAVLRAILTIEQGTISLAAAIAGGTARLEAIDGIFDAQGGIVTKSETTQSTYDNSNDGKTLVNDVKGAQKFQAGNNSVVNTLECLDESGSTVFSVSKDGLVTSALSGPAWVQYTNSSVFNAITGIIPIDQDANSFTNSKFINQSPTELRVLFNGFARVTVKVTADSNINDATLKACLLKNGVPVATPNCSAVSSGRGTQEATATFTFVVDCLNGDDFSIEFDSLTGNLSTIDIGDAYLLIELIKEI
jgi:hypothetical protein